MAFFKFRKSSPSPDAPRARGETAAPPETVESLRRRALYRLIGAAVLVLVAVIGFPMLFDTQPRPVAINAPIAIPDRDNAPPLALPASAPAQSTSSDVSAGASLSAGEEVVATSSASSAATVAAPPAADHVSSAPRTAPLTGPPPERVDQDARVRQQTAQQAAQQAARQEAARRDAARRDAAKRDAEKRKAEQAKAGQAQRQRAQADAARARALLDGQDAPDATASAAASSEPEHHDGKPASVSAPAAHDASAAKNGSGATKGGHYAIQIGAYADAQSTQAARQKAERAGVKTYTQTVATSAGQRTRVRVGPFASRDEAERALSRLRQAGLGGSILSQ